MQKIYHNILSIFRFSFLAKEYTDLRNMSDVLIKRADASDDPVVEAYLKAAAGAILTALSKENDLDQEYVNAAAEKTFRLLVEGIMSIGGTIKVVVTDKE